MLIYVSPASEVKRLQDRHPDNKLASGRSFLTDTELKPQYNPLNAAEVERAMTIAEDLLVTRNQQQPGLLCLTSMDHLKDIGIAVILDDSPDRSLMSKFINRGVRVVTDAINLDTWMTNEFRTMSDNERSHRKAVQLLHDMNLADDPSIRRVGIAADQLRRSIEADPTDDDVISAKRGLLRQRLLEYELYHGQRASWWADLYAL